MGRDPRYWSVLRFQDAISFCQQLPHLPKELLLDPCIRRSLQIRVDRLKFLLHFGEFTPWHSRNHPVLPEVERLQILSEGTRAGCLWEWHRCVTEFTVWGRGNSDASREAKPPCQTADLG